MAESLKIRVFDLIPELLAHAFILRQLLKPARTVAPGAFQPLSDIVHNLFISILGYMHRSSHISALRHTLLKLCHLSGHFLYLIPQDEDAVCLLSFSCDNILGQ